MQHANRGVGWEWLYDVAGLSQNTNVTVHPALRTTILVGGLPLDSGEPERAWADVVAPNGVPARPITFAEALAGGLQPAWMVEPLWPRFKRRLVRDVRSTRVPWGWTWHAAAAHTVLEAEHGIGIAEWYVERGLLCRLVPREGVVPTEPVAWEIAGPILANASNACQACGVPGAVRCPVPFGDVLRACADCLALAEAERWGWLQLLRHRDPRWRGCPDV